MKKLIVITGASSGFGKELAYLFSNAGHPLLLIGRRKELMYSYGLPYTLIKKVDVTDYSAFELAVKEAEIKFGPVDLLINNAGVMHLGNVANQNPLEWKNMLDTNVIGVLNGTKIVLESMIERKTGTIINVSSISGKKTFANHAAYSASKYGVHALTETIREEVSDKNIRLLLVAPGASETELLEHTTSSELKENYREWKKTMGGLSLDPKYVASSIKFMYDLPQEVAIRELTIAETKQNA